jgi:WD40 repeat protein
VDESRRTALSVDRNDILRHWDLSSGSCLRDWKPHTSETAERLVQSSTNWLRLGPGGRFAVTATLCDDGMPHEYNAVFTVYRVWSLDSGKCRLEVGWYAGRESLHAVDDDFRAVLLAHGASQCRVVRLDTGEPGIALPAVEHSGLAFLSVRLGMVAMSGPSGTVRLLRLADGSPGPLLVGHSSPITSIAVAGSSGRLLSGDGSGRVLAWDLGSGREVARLEGCRGRVTWIRSDPDGRRFAVRSTGPHYGESALQVWVPPETTPRRSFLWEGSEVRSLSIDPRLGWACYLASDDEPRIVELVE